MKTLLILVACSAFPGSITGQPRKPSVMVVSHNYDIFYFKVKKDLVGGTVEVYDDHQNLMATQPLNRRKIIIDFFDARPGQYTIRVIGHDSRFEYLFSKKGEILKIPLPAQPEGGVSSTFGK